jgi:hypothetical protein
MRRRASNMALQRTRAARFARIGSPLNARPFGGAFAGTRARCVKVRQTRRNPETYT